MSEHQERDDATTDDVEPKMGIPDENLPDDLVASEDNPLAEGLPPGKTVEDVRRDDAEEESGRPTGTVAPTDDE